MKLTVLAVCKVSKFWFLWLSMLSSFQMFLPYTSPGTCLINRAPPLLSQSVSPLPPICFSPSHIRNLLPPPCC
uniref:Uncharacterized protein n=1 Tax=Anguilla anguilla TaxID=7936 RepID=A0A0E9X6Q6_ANGAN